MAVNGKVYLDTSKNNAVYDVGVSVAIFNYDNCTLTNVKSFDTYTFDYSGATAALISYISNVHNGSILVAITSDDPWKQIQPAYPLLEPNGVDTSILGYRGKFAFVSQVGGKAGFVAETKNSSFGNVQLYVCVQGMDS